MQFNRGPGGRTPGAGLARVLRGESTGGLTRIASSASRRRSRRILAAFLPALLGVAAFTSSASAALNQVGPVDPNTNFPSWYADGNGLALQPCRSDLSGNCAAGLYTLPPVGGAPSGEGFYFLAQATIGPLTVSNALEGAYAPGTGPGLEGAFVRTISYAPKGGLSPNTTYKITDPYGTFTCTSDANGVIPKKGSTGCRTDTPGIVAGDFTGALRGRIGPFLTWDTYGGQGIGAPPPAGFIGDGVTSHAVVGSPTGFNKLRVEGPGFTGTCTNPDGTTVSNCQETNLFIVQGQVQPGPSAATSTNSLDFGNVATGTPVTKRVTYTSTGSAPVNVSGVTLGGANAADFSESDTCTTTPPATSFAPGSTCTIDVTYTPRAGTSNATLTIADDTAGSPRTISLTGQSVPVLSVSTASLGFGSVKVGGTSAQQTVTVSNNGAAPMTVSSTLGGAFPGDFQITPLAASDCGAGPVAPGASCRIAVQFTPTTAGDTSASLIVKESLGTSKTVALTGTGTQSTFSLSTTSVAFASTTAGSTSAAKSVTVTNNGNATGLVDGADLGGADATQFKVGSAGTCVVGTTNLAPGTSCVVQVAFAPTSAGAKAGTLAISVDGAAKNVALSGTATAPIDGTAPSVPTAVKATASSSTAVSVTWTASTDNVGVTGYQVFRGGVQVGTATGTSYSDTGLTASTAYSYTVKAVDAAGNTSAASTAASVTTPAAPDTQAPTVPTGLTGSATNSTTVSLSWTASTDNVGVAGYNVYRDGTLLKKVTTTSTTDTVAASSTHTYAVSAVDAVPNESAQTTAVSVTTPASAPVTRPTVTARTPGVGATAVANTTPVTATFSENVSGVSGTTFTLTNGTTAVPATVSYDANTHVATLTPSSALANDTKYTAALKAGITNAAGGALATTSWSFTTGPRPTVTAKTPASGATAVVGTTAVTATFSEAVAGVSGTTFTLKTAAGTAVTATVAYDATTHVATLTPSAALPNDTKYTAALTTAIKDAAGNPIAATSWSFTTGPRPTVTAKSPASGATAVSRTTSVAATFSEAVTGVSTTTVTLKPVSPTGTLGTAVTATVSYNATTRVATLVPSTTLAASTKYTAALTTGIKDIAGNPIAATSWSFTTGP